MGSDLIYLSLTPLFIEKQNIHRVNAEYIKMIVIAPYAGYISSLIQKEAD
ncbi:hypothetical protein Salpa_4360 [Sporomusa sp. KB1]|jgi:hypothetical protein|nr:hypothetical protein Salpa_4360 [Sporomusa sp. KB1]